MQEKTQALVWALESFGSGLLRVNTHDETLEKSLLVYGLRFPIGGIGGGGGHWA